MIFALSARLTYRQSQEIAMFIRRLSTIEEGVYRRIGASGLLIQHFVRGYTTAGRTLELFWSTSSSPTEVGVDFHSSFPDGSARMARNVANELVKVGIHNADVQMKVMNWEKHFGVSCGGAFPSSKQIHTVELRRLIPVLDGDT